MKNALKILLTALFAGWMGLAGAQQTLEIIELKGKTVEQVLPSLRPLLEPGATLSGMNNQLFLRASVRNRSEIKRALAAIDTPSRQLMIHISQNREADTEARGASANGQIVLGSTHRGNVEARVWETRSLRHDAGGQMVRALEGSPALIQMGYSLPLPMRQIIVGPAGTIINESIVYQDMGQGFYALPRLNGSQVTVEISQQADTPGQFGRGSVNTQRLSTTVSGRLGEWMELGGAGQQESTRQGGAWNASTREVDAHRSIWLKVEEVD
jgi:type II secretory pathway component GspD/PulD (secretin)